MGKVVGGAIFVLGLGLFFGNVTGAMPTFAGAGWICVALGGWIFNTNFGQDDAD